MSSKEGKEEMERRVETELDKLVREIKQREREEREEAKKPSFADHHITSHFDQSTLRLKQKIPITLDGSFFKNILSSFGIIDGVTIDKNKVYVMFRFRDSALKAHRILSEQSCIEDERQLLLKDYSLKIVSTSKAQNREVKEKHKARIEDPINQIKSQLKVQAAVLGKKREGGSQPIEELENSLMEKLKARKLAK